MKKLLQIAYALLVILPIGGCLSEVPQSDPHWWIEQAIEAHGGQKYQNVKVSFQFRDKHYEINRQGGSFEYRRIFTDSVGNKVKDVLFNQGFRRFVNDTLVQLPVEKANAFSNSVNSVAYFALVPFVLKDPAVQAELKGSETIQSQEYQKIQVTFKQQGGGKDYQDVFLYWVNMESYLIDYLAYSYETDGGGMRFRRAYNRRKAAGVMFSDYENYKPAHKSVPLDSLAGLFQSNQLQMVSVIENKQLKGH